MPLRGITCNKRKFMLFNAIDQRLARSLAETVMLNSPKIQPWIFGVHVSHDAIPLNLGRLWLAFKRGHRQGT